MISYKLLLSFILIIHTTSNADSTLSYSSAIEGIRDDSSTIFPTGTTNFISDKSTVPSNIFDIDLVKREIEDDGPKKKKKKKVVKKKKKKATTTPKPAPTEPPIKKDNPEVKFADWKQWPVMYENCNPKTNPYLSPIKIDTKKVVTTKSTQTLMVYSSKSSKGAYYFTTSTEIAPGYTIELPSIQVEAKRFRDVTFVSGLGDTRYRFFHSAYFFLTNKTLDPLRSFHQIDDQKHDMEIVVTFRDPTNQATTNVHILVNVSSTMADNPAFMPITYVIQMHQSDMLYYDDSLQQESRYVAIEDRDYAKDHYDELVEQEKEETGGSTYAQAYAEVSELLTRVQKADRQLHRIPPRLKQTETRKKRADQRVKAMEKKLEKLKKKRSRLLALYDRKVARGELERGGEDETTDAIRKTKEQIRVVQSKLKNGKQNQQTLQGRMERQMKMMNDASEVLNSNLIGTSPVQLYASVKDVSKKVEELKRKDDDIKQALQAYEDASAVLETEFNVPPRSSFIDNPFQVSVFHVPFFGGHYVYNGSDPLPPCNRRHYVVVLERAVTISKEQFEHFKSVVKAVPGVVIADYSATHPNAEVETLDKLIPRIHEVGNRTVWYNKKNLQFKFDDTFHMVSKLRRKLKKERHGNGNQILARFWMTVVLTLSLHWSPLSNY